MKTEAVYSRVSYQTQQATNSSLIHQFMAWAESKEPVRLTYLAGMLIIHGNITAPLALFSMFLVDGGLFQLIVITVFSFTILVVNLAALPTKITLPVYIASTLAVAALIIINFINAFLL